MRCFLKLLLPVIFAFGYGTLYAQKEGKDLVDSLLRELPKYKEDTAKLKVLDAISGNFEESYPDESIKYELEELGLAEKLNQKTYMARAYLHLGNDYMAKSDYAKAKDYMFRCLNLARNAEGIAEVQTKIAKLYEYQIKYDSALIYYGRVLKIYDSLHINTGIAVMMLYISYIYKLKDDYLKTLAYSYNALKICQRLDSEEYKGIAPALEGVVGEAYLGIAQDTTGTIKPGGLVGPGKNANLDSAVKYLIMGIVGNEAGQKDKMVGWNNSVEFSHALTDAYLLSENYKKAFETIKHCHALEDSVRDGNDKKENETREMVHQLNESQINLENKELETEKKARFLFIAGIGLMLLLIAFIFRNFSNQKKANKLISKEKEQISRLKNEIEEKHKQTIDSVNYAKRIQTAILPSDAEIGMELPRSLIILKPKDIVSGDFYWFSKKENQTIIAAVDCTGHGVPGAFMSMIGNTLLNEIVNEKGILAPGDILTRMDQAVNEALKQNKEGSDSRDGMDVAICVLDKTNNTLRYAGANRPLYYFTKNDTASFGFNIYKPNKFPIGGFDAQQEKKFDTHIIQLNPGDTFFIFTDGYADQFGGENGKKLMTGKFKELLLSVQHLSMSEQDTWLKDHFEEWKGANEQVDDVLVIGVRV